MHAASADTSAATGSTHTCLGEHACFVCGCIECGYTVDVPRLHSAAHAHLHESSVSDNDQTGLQASSVTHTRTALARLRGLVSRVVTCRHCGRAAHSLCAQHPLDHRPWLTPVHLSVAEHQKGLQALQTVLQAIHASEAESRRTPLPEASEGASVHAIKAEPTRAVSASPADIKREPADEDDEAATVEARQAGDRFPPSPSRTGPTPTTSSSALTGGTSPAARPPPPPPSARAGTAPASATAHTAATTMTTAQTASVAKSESPATATDPFFCSLDCALRLELRPNPLFDPRMSQRYTRTAEDRLNEMWLVAATASPTSPPPESPAEAHGDPAPAVLQVWYEAWLHYFAEDSVVHGRFPPFFPPTFTDADERVLAAVSGVLTPEGQARRLCGLDPAQHRVGSMLVVPEAGLWDGLRLVEPGATTTFVSEQLEAYLRTAVEPVPVVQKRPREVTASPSTRAGGSEPSTAKSKSRKAE